jgi:predicted DNA-binding transcriptional regulator AlpA
MSIREVADFLGVCTATAYNLVADGRLRSRIAKSSSASVARSPGDIENWGLSMVRVRPPAPSDRLN